MAARFSKRSRRFAGLHAHALTVDPVGNTVPPAAVIAASTRWRASGSMSSAATHPPPPAPHTLPPERALLARTRNNTVDDRRRDRRQIALNEGMPIPRAPAARLRSSHLRKSDARTCTATAAIRSRLRNTARSPLMCRVYTSPIVDRRLARLLLRCSTGPAAALQLRGVAAKLLAPFATPLQDEARRTPPNVGGWIMIHCVARGNANHNRLHVPADVNPLLAVQSRAGESVERRADGHGHGARAADPGPCWRLGSGREHVQTRPRTKKAHHLREQRQPVLASPHQRFQRREALPPPRIQRDQRDALGAAWRTVSTVHEARRVMAQLAVSAPGWNR